MVKLDRKVLLELPAGGRDALGGPASGPARETHFIWAAVDETAARAALLSGREDTVAATTFTINWRPRLSNSWIIRYGGQIYRIVGWMERGRQRYFDVLTEVVR